VESTDAIAEEVEVLLGQSRQSSLGLVHRQPESCHQLPHCRQCCRSISRSAADDEVVGVIDDMGIELLSVAESLPGQKEATEVEVRQ
jgi:hypothetical protein